MTSEAYIIGNKQLPQNFFPKLSVLFVEPARDVTKSLPVPFFSEITRAITLANRKSRTSRKKLEEVFGATNSHPLVGGSEQ